MKNDLIRRMKHKSRQGLSKHRVVAVGFNAKGELLGIAINRPAMNRFYRHTHAECILMDRYGRSLAKIVIARFNHTGSQLAIDPCPMCAARAKSMNITIESV